VPHKTVLNVLLAMQAIISNQIMVPAPLPVRVGMWPTETHKLAKVIIILLVLFYNTSKPQKVAILLAMVALQRVLLIALLANLVISHSLSQIMLLV
jgi:hypothetical protein